LINSKGNIEFNERYGVAIEYAWANILEFFVMSYDIGRDHLTIGGYLLLKKMKDYDGTNYS
jgi:hypothetical protein